MKLVQVTDLFGITNSRANQPTQPEIQNVNPETLGEKKVYLEWQTTARVQRKGANQKLMRTFTIIGAVVALLLVLMHEFTLILVIASVIFISQILSKTPPEVIKHEVSSHGVSYAGQLYRWAELKQFFFTKNNELDILAVDTKDPIPGRLFLSIHAKDKDHLKEVISKYLPYLEHEPRTVFDKAFDSVMSKFNFEGK